jgi:hypothetical protein
MQRQVIGATLALLGVLMLLLEPVGGVGQCADFTDRAGYCREQTYRLLGLINWPAGWWDRLALPQLIIGVALVATGIVLLVKARRSRGSASTA